MRFSVIVPVYNAEKYLAECVESVLAQEFRDFELILVDDGSADASGRLCMDFAMAHPNVRALRQENAGAMAARRAGLMAARGDYVAYLDADDRWEANLLRLASEGLFAFAADVLIFGHTYGRDGKIEGEKRLFSGDCAVTRAMLVEKLIASSDMNPVWDKVVSRELALRCAGEDASHEGVAEDLVTVLPVLGAARRVAYIDRTPYYYRTVDESRSHAFRPHRHREIDAARARVLDWLVETGENSDENLAKFYTLYVDRMLDCLTRAARSGAERRAVKAAFAEVRGFALFQMARFYPLALTGRKRAQFRLVNLRMDGLFVRLAKTFNAG